MSYTKLLSAGAAGIALFASAAAAQDFTLRYGNAQPETAIRSQSMVFFEEQLEARSDGRIEVETFFGGTLGNEREMMDQVTSGLLQGTRGGFFADASGAFNIYQLPFLVDSWDEKECLVASDFTGGIQMRAAENGYHIPATGISQGFRAYTTNARPITKVADLEGLQIREPQSDLMIAGRHAGLGRVPGVPAWRDRWPAQSAAEHLGFQHPRSAGLPVADQPHDGPRPADREQGVV